MPSCVALGCSGNQDRSSLKIFPRKDTCRRQIWIDRVNRPGWMPTKYSALCELHFDRDQWEQPREDGKRKLKASALPTIFFVHKSCNSVIFEDHSYCLPNYRKIYDDCDKDGVLDEEGTMPIEHVKVEVEENENFNLETVEEEEEGAEDIQCTPDISSYPEKGEPFPIEVVECQNNNINTMLMEPVNDPLAISTEDRVQINAVNPYFGHSQKMLFIPKGRKMVSNISSDAKGEPLTKPRLKVKSLDGLLDPNVLKSPPRKNANVDLKSTMKSPTAIYLKEPLTLPETPTFPRYPKLGKLDTEKSLSSLESSKFSRFKPPKLKVIPSTAPSVPKLNLVSNQVIVLENLNFVRPKTGNIKAPISLLPSSNIWVERQTNLNTTNLSNPKIKNMQFTWVKKKIPGNIMRKSINNSALKPTSNQKHEQETEDEESESVIKSVIHSIIEKCVQLESIMTDHHYTRNSFWKSVTIDEEKPKGGLKHLENTGTNQVKVWLKSKKVPDISDSNDNSPRLKVILPKPILQNKNIPPGCNSSIVILKPFNNAKQINCDEKSQENSSDQFQGKIVNQYKCDLCKFEFITFADLKAHKREHERALQEKQDNLENTFFNGSDDDSSSDFKGFDSEEENVSNYSDLSIDSSRTLTAEEGTDSSRTDSADEEVSVMTKGKITKKSISIKYLPQQFENKLVSIPDINALRKLQKNRTMNSSSSTGIQSEPGLFPITRINQKHKASKQMSKKSKRKAEMLRESKPLPNKRAKLSHQALYKRVIGARVDINKKVQTENTSFNDKYAVKKSGVSENPVVLLPKVHLNNISNSHLKEGSSKLNSKKKKDENFRLFSDTKGAKDKPVRLPKLIKNMTNKSMNKVTKEISSSKQDDKNNKDRRPIVLLTKVGVDEIKKYRPNEIENRSKTVKKTKSNYSKGKCFVPVSKVRRDNSTVGKPLPAINNNDFEDTTLMKSDGHKNKNHLTLPPKGKINETRRKVSILRKTKELKSENEKYAENNTSTEKYKFPSDNNECVITSSIMTRNRVKRNKLRYMEDKKKEDRMNNKMYSKVNQRIVSKNTAFPGKMQISKTELIKEDKVLGEKMLPKKSQNIMCQICRLFVKKSKLRSHELQHKDLNTMCKVCNKEFPLSFKLRRHMKTEHDTKVRKRFR